MKKRLLILLAIWALPSIAMAVDYYVPAHLPELADSAKWFIRSADASTITDSTAGAARLNVTSYDTVLTFNTIDSAYTATLRIWYPATDSFATWVFEFPIRYTKEEIAGVTDDTLGFVHGNALWTTSPSGSGAFGVSYFLVDTSEAPEKGISQARLYITNVAETGAIFVATTDVNGKASFQLDADTYVIFHTLAGFNVVKDTFTLVATLDDTLEVFTSVGPRTVVFGNVGGAGGNLANSVVTAALVSVNETELTIADTLYVQGFSKDTSDAFGFFEIALYRNDEMSDSALYKFTFKDENGRRIKLGGQAAIYVHLRIAEVVAGRVSFNAIPRVAYE